MSQPNTFENDQPMVPPAQQQGGSGKFWLGLGLGCGVVILLCCGGFAAFSFVSMRALSKGFSDDPQIAQERVDQIAEITLPAEFRPQSSFEFVIPFQNRKALSWVAYTAPAARGGESVIVLGQFYAQLAAETRDQLMEQIHASIREQQKAHEHVTIDEEKTFTREFTIRDQPAEFLFQEGVGHESEQRYRIVVGQFAGKAGTALLYMQVDPEELSDDQVVEIIESIK